MFFNAPNTKRNRIAAMVAIVAGLGVGFLFATSGDDDSGVSDIATEQAAPSIPIPASPTVSPTLEDIDFSAYSSDLAKYVGLERGESRIAAIDKVRLYFAPDTGDIVQTSQSSFDRPDGSVLLFSVNGLADDSVRAQEVFLILQGEQGDQTLAEYGMRIKCYRGDNTMEWQTDLCP